MTENFRVTQIRDIYYIFHWGKLSVLEIDAKCFTFNMVNVFGNKFILNTILQRKLIASFPFVM